MLTITSPEGLNLDEYTNYHITEEESARMRTIINSATKLEGMVAPIEAIIIEEAELFLACARSAEDTAAIIQSRVSIYVSENM